MDGLLLRLLDKEYGSPGRWFWECFQPLRSAFDRYYWILPNQPWMSAPATFDGARECADYEGVGNTSIGLWRPGAIGRWAEQFCEECIELWAVKPVDDPARLASSYSNTFYRDMDAFIELHADIWMNYCDTACWEVYAQQSDLLRLVHDHVRGNPLIRVYSSSSSNRGLAYANAGIGDLWHAMRGKKR